MAKEQRTKLAPSSRSRLRKGAKARTNNYRGNRLYGTQSSFPGMMPTYANQVKNVSNISLAGPVAPLVNTTMKYVQQVSLASNASGLAAAPWFFNMNGMYDPDQTGTGHQPYGFDQYAALYSLYTVTHVSINIAFHGIGTSNVVGVWRMQHSQSGGTPFTGLSAQDFMEVPQGGGVICNNSNGGENVTQVKLGKISIATMEGLTEKDIQGDNPYQAVVTANPIRTPRIGLGVCGTTGVAVSGLATITLLYHVRWSGRVGLPGS